MMMRAIVMLLVVAATAGAQQPARGAASRVDPLSVRAEYASTLLQARQYREAAAEYRRLLAQQPGNFAWRLNRARALAWGGAYREAEAELVVLSARAPGNGAVDELLRSVRANIVPSSREARAWVAERPGHPPYRLALARAYVRERNPRAAFPHYDDVLSRQWSVALAREAGDARVAGGDRAGAVVLYRRAVDRAPADHGLRRAYAAALAANREYAAALQQYTILYDQRPAPSLLTDRAEVRWRSGDEPGAERDLQSSIGLLPTPDAYLALGDLYRSRQQFGRARSAYLRVVDLRPGDRSVGSRLVRLARAQRPGFGYASMLDERAGGRGELRAVADNADFTYVAAGARVGTLLAPQTVLAVGVEPRVVSGRSPAGERDEPVVPTRRLTGIGASIGIAHTYHGDDVDARIAGRGGVVDHAADSTVAQLAAGAVVSYRGTWSLSLEGRQGPAYAELMALAPDAGRASFPMRSRAFSAGMTAPMGVADFGAGFERLSLSDGNERSVVQASVRVPVSPGVSILYSGAALGFEERSTLYWDPSSYVSHALGLEVAARSDDGFALTARVLPGLGRAVEGLTAGAPGRVPGSEVRDARFAGQLAASLGLDLRSGPWRTALGASYGSGRGGGYRRFEATLRVHLER